MGLGALLGAGTMAPADTIASFTWSTSLGTGGTWTSADLSVGTGGESPHDTSSRWLFEGAYTSADVGRTLVASADNDPDFDAFVAQLVDGSSDWVHFSHGPGWTSMREGRVFWGDAADPRIDLHGVVDAAAIDNITLHINALQITHSQLHTGAPWSDFSTSVTLSINTAESTATVVPLPAAAWGGAALFGALGVTRFRRRRCHGTEPA